MNLTNSRIMFALNANATSSQHNISGDFQIGGSIESYPLVATTAYSLKASCPENGIFSFNPATGVAAIDGSWANPLIYQSLQLVNPSWGDGVIEGVTSIYSTIFTDATGTIEISIDVAEGETPEVWGETLVGTYNDYFAGTGYVMDLIGTEVIFKSDIESSNALPVMEYNDFAIGNPKVGLDGIGSTYVVPPSPFGISGGTGNDFDGNPIGTITPQAMLIKAGSAFSVELQDTTKRFDIPANGVVLLKELTEETNWVFTSSVNGSIEIVVVG